MLVSEEEFNKDEYEAKLTKESEEIHHKYDIKYSSTRSFVDSVVDALLDYLDKETLDFIRETTDVFWLHMGLGMWIRNMFIWGYTDKIFSPLPADDLSAMIIDELKNRLKETM